MSLAADGLSVVAAYCVPLAAGRLILVGAMCVPLAPGRLIVVGACACRSPPTGRSGGSGVPLAADGPVAAGRGCRLPRRGPWRPGVRALGRGLRVREGAGFGRRGMRHVPGVGDQPARPAAKPGDICGHDRWTVMAGRAGVRRRVDLKLS
ncbi:hypothetical protein GCM10022419_015570 [Nonomuraea rosea]|uniref:Uncharacterized protein n=1 Tax=Nonomuraea rosea TaxID=638574 RepID=A0ABP6VJI6_9ACTN